MRFFADYGMTYVDSAVQFRFPIAFQIFFALIAMFLTYILPESPRWVRSGIHDQYAAKTNSLIAGRS